MKREMPTVLARYRAALRAESNPLGTQADLWEDTRAHAELILADCAYALDAPPPTVTPALHPPGHDQDGDGEGELAFSSSLGVRRALARARLIDSLCAVENLKTAVLEAVLGLIEGEPAGVRAVVGVRAAQVIAQVAARRTQAAVLSYEAHLLQEIGQANGDDRARLARDIHDHLGNSLALAFRRLELFELATAADGVSPSVAGLRHLEAIRQSLESATDFTRSLVSGLRAQPADT
ncbi:histidine kinase, partial [Streptomyces sp. NPDC048595]|uniref:histidine kinase n=1 Tax=Streptomyces sp. NPDC048595 TaxID=3365576 RepID=UPI003719BB35